MSRDPQRPNCTAPASEHPERPHRMLLTGLLIIAISTCGWFTLHWYTAIRELRQVKQELKTTELELKNARQFLEAQRLINKRQADMLRAAIETPAKP